MTLDKVCRHKLNGECKSCLAMLDSEHHSFEECVDYDEALNVSQQLYTIKSIGRMKEK